MLIPGGGRLYLPSSGGFRAWFLLQSGILGPSALVSLG